MSYLGVAWSWACRGLRRGCRPGLLALPMLLWACPSLLLLLLLRTCPTNLLLLLLLLALPLLLRTCPTALLLLMPCLTLPPLLSILVMTVAFRRQCC